MEYKGRYRAFDPAQIKTYPLGERTNKVRLADLLEPDSIGEMSFSVPEEIEDRIAMLAGEIISARKNERPVLLFTGAHLIKNGLGLLLADLVRRGLLTMVSGNGATSIHDFELGLVGRVIRDESFRKEVEKILGLKRGSIAFAYPEICLQAVCYEKNIPMTIHAGIGTDVMDQHLYFDGEAKGGCSGRDFLIYTEEVSRLSDGGVILNVGSAVTGPEVFLKAASMTGNTGQRPGRIITADFDLRPYNPDSFADENAVAYYYRDQKSIVTRIPQAYGGQGFYIEGNQKQTFPLLYKKLVQP